MRQSVQMLSHVQLFATPWTAAQPASLSIINSWSLLKHVSIKTVMPSNHLIFCRSLLLPPSIFPSVGVFSNESALQIRWPKYWSLSFSITSSSEYSILPCSAFIIVQLSHPYMTTRKTIAFTAAKSLQSCPTLCEPTRLLCTWNFPGKSTRVGYHFLLPSFD